MSNGIDFSAPGIAKIRVDRPWLAADGRLRLCIGKPPRRVDEIADDRIAPDSSAFAKAILERNQNNTSNLQTWFTGGPGLLLLPEYAFSSKDFPVIDATVREHPTPVIVLAGFGAVLGTNLTALLNNGCSAAWQGGANILAERGR